jgi:hypothetical protein
VSRRIVIAGVSGNGKTTLGRRLAQRLGVPFTELDALMHQPGWVPAETGTFRHEVEAVMDASDGWVLDGMYQGQLGDLVLRRADTLVWRVAFFTRDSLISFAIKSHFKRRREWPAAIGAPPNLEIVPLRSPREVEYWPECQAPD